MYLETPRHRIYEALTACDLSVGILCQMCVQDCVTDDVAHLVGMSLADGLAREEEPLLRSAV